MKNQTILLVDKKTLYVKDAIRVLMGAGFNTVHASTCDQALKETQKQDRKINLILLDINLCNGVSETQTIQKILNENDIPVMLLISDLDNEVIINSNHITSYGYVNKNSSEVILIASIKSTLKLHSEILQNKLLFNSSADGIHILDTEGNVVQVTDSFCKMLGYTAEEMSSMNVAQWDANWTDNELKEILKHQTKIVKIFNTKHRHRDGHLIDVEISMIKVDLESQTVFFASARDITKRLQIEKSLKESEEKYKQLVDFAPTPIMVHQDGRFVAVNQETIELFGAKNESELLGTLVIDRVHPDFVNTVKKRINDITIEGKRAPVLEEKLFRLDGTIIDAEVSAVPISYKGRSAVQIVIRDITEQNKAKRLLKESEERHRTFLENLSDIAYELDVNGNLTFVNKAAELITGEKVSEWMGKSFMPLLTEESRQVAFLGVQRVLSTGHSESEVNLINGKVLLFRSELKTDNSGKVVGILGIGRDVTERKKAENALRLASSQRNALMNNLDSGILYEDESRRVIYANKGFCNLFGISSPELIIDSDCRILSQQAKTAFVDQEDFVNKIEDIITKQEIVKNEEILLVDGRTLERDYIPLFIDKVYRGHIWQYRDISDRKRIELERIRNISLLRATLESTADGILVVDNSGKITDFNKRFAQMWNIPESILELHDDEQALDFVINQLEEADSFLQKVHELYSNPKAESFDLLKFKDGRYFERFSRPQLLMDKPIGRVWSFRDVTDRMKSEIIKQEHINEITNLYELTHDLADIPDNLNTLLSNIVKRATSLLHRTDGGMYLYDRDRGDLVVATATNPLKPVGFRVQLGEGMAGRVALNRQPMIIDDYRSWSNGLPIYSGTVLTTVIEVPMLYQGELIGVLAVEEFSETAKKFTENDMRLLTIFAGQAAGAVHTARLLNDIQLKNDELKISNATKDKFFSIIAHDLRSPFQGILGVVELLTNEIDSLSKSEIANFSHKLKYSLTKQYELLSDLLEWARLQTGNIEAIPEIIPLSSQVEMVIDSLKLLANQKDITIENAVDDETEVYSDHELLRIVLRNLISNSIKFTKPGGLISISAKRKEIYSEVTISDTGVGIAKEALDKIFRIDVHYSTEGTAKEKGTGLGLILCKEIIERQKGKIWAESNLNKGSKFTFVLPSTAKQEPII
ncbi:MAG: multi-sensor hybrid histidine [Ignavibacteria bacterium]|nr:MAG: multi-sensor hybrid histidine [Ignavibacteria bacterium]